MGDDVVGTILTLDEAMSVALKAALGGIGRVSPNPPVGAVLLGPKNECLALGFHAELGGPHAEAALLNKFKDDQVPKGSRLIVTLEPCAHEGRTPSCAKRLAKLPLAEVIYGLPDPGGTSGGGAQILSSVGIKAAEYQGPLKVRLKELTEVFFHNVQKSLPFVALKCAVTLDGKIALKESGESQWITGQESRLYSHYLRALYDAVLVGERTFEVDNPSLTVRHPDFPGHRGKVIVLSPRSQTWSKLKSSKLQSSHSEENIIWICGSDHLPANPGKVRVVPVALTSESLFDIPSLLKSLFDLGVHSVLVEGGAGAISSFLRPESAQRLHLFMAPKIMGSGGLGWADGFSVTSLSDILTLQNGEWKAMGEDLYFTARL